MAFDMMKINRALANARIRGGENELSDQTLRSLKEITTELNRMLNPCSAYSAIIVAAALKRLYNTYRSLAVEDFPAAFVDGLIEDMVNLESVEFRFSAGMMKEDEE